jgi:MFS family permease
MVLVTLDSSATSLAFPTIAQGLSLSPTGLQWALVAYPVAFSGCLLLGGRLADALGERRMLTGGLLLSTLGAAAAAVATGPFLIILGRTIEGVAAAVTFPAGLSLIIRTFPPGPRLHRAQGVLGASLACGFLGGAVLGGALATIFGWRAIFLCLALWSLAVVPAAMTLTADAQPIRLRPRDLTTALVPMLLIASAVQALAAAPSVPFLSVRMLTSIGIIVALGTLLVLVRHRLTVSFIPRGLLTDVNLTRASGLAFIVVGAIVAIQFAVSLQTQTLLGLSPNHTAIAFLAMGVASACSGRAAPWVNERYSRSRALMGALVVHSVGTCLLAISTVTPSDISFPVILLACAFVGAADMQSIVILNMMATTRIADVDQGVAAGVFYTSHQIGAAAFLAATSGVLTSSQDLTSSVSPSNLLIVFLFMASTTISAAVFVTVRLARRSRMPRELAMAHRQADHRATGFRTNRGDHEPSVARAEQDPASMESDYSAIDSGRVPLTP